MFSTFNTKFTPSVILNDMNLIAVVTDSIGQLIYVSPATEKLLGFSEAELIRKGWWQKTYLSKDESAGFKKKVKQTIQGEIPLKEKPYDRQIVCKDGTVKWIEWRDSLGEGNTYISVGVDITEWKKEEKENKLNQDILKNIKSIILVSKNNGDVIYVSPSVNKILGFSHTELVGKGWWENTYKSDYEAQKSKEAILKKLYTKEKIYINIGRQKIKTKDGSFKWIEWQRSKSIDNTFISIGTDVTNKILSEIELHKAKEDAEKSLKAKNEFLANMSHEIRTPLNGIIGFTDLLLETKITDEQRQYLEAMHHSGEILLSIINDVLDLSKLESGKLEVESIMFDLHQQVHKVVNLMDVKAKHKNIDLKLNINKNTPQFIKSDPTKIGQILLNLIGNAIKFTNQGSVTVNVYLNEVQNSTSDEVYFEIVDTGIGIVPNKINTVFGAFNQAKSDTSRIYGGTGLGLTIVKKLVNLLKGEIKVSSVFGSGSKFTLSLPLKSQQTTKAEVASKTLTEVTEFAPLNLDILLVEDNKTNQLLAKTRLQKWQCNVDIAKHGLEGVKKTQTKLYDIILMDVQMPVMDGYEATKIIKNDISEEVSKIPILGMSAYTSSTETKKMINAGMEDYIYKPFKPDELYQKLVKYTKKD